MPFRYEPKRLLELLADHPLRGLLWTTVALLAIRPAVEQTAALLVVDAVFIAVLVAVVRRLAHSKRLFRFCLVLLTATVLARIVRELQIDGGGGSTFDWTITATTLLSGAFVAFVLALLLNYALRAPRVTQNTVLASVCAYVLLGVVWGFIYLLIYEFNPAAFTLDTTEGTPEVQLLVLSKEKSLELFEEYPEDNTTICANLMATFDLTIEGKKIAGTEEDVTDKDKMETKTRIIESMEQRIEQRFAALCQAARTGDADAVATLARQGCNLSQANYDGRTAMRE